MPGFEPVHSGPDLPELEEPAGISVPGGLISMVGLIGRLSNWLACLTEEEVAWARRGLGPYSAGGNPTTSI